MVERTSSRRPLVWLAGALGSGTLLGLESWPAAGAGLVGLALAAQLLARRGRAPRWVACVLLLAGARASALRGPPSDTPPLRAVEAQAAREDPVVGFYRAARDGRTGWIEPFDGARTPGPGHGLLLEPVLGPPESGTPVALLPGGEVVPWARGPVRAPLARSRGFRALSTVQPDELVRLAPAPRRPWTPLLERVALWRALLGQRVAALEREHSAGLLRALLTGDRSALAPERADLFARTGTSHLLAISGWHVGLFAVLVLRPLARARPRSRRSVLALALRGLLLIAFAAVAGAEKPVLRATLAVLLLQLAALRGLRAEGPPPRPDGLTFLAAAFALECLLDPAGIRSLSLGLSYAATLGLILGTGPLARALRPARERWSELAPGPLRATARALRTRAQAALASGLAASCAAVLATLPLTWTTFGEFAPAGALFTLLVLPPFTLLCLLAWSTALVPWHGLALPAELAARALLALLELADALPGTPLVLPPRPLALLVLAAALVFLGLRHAPARRAAALLWGLVLLPWSAAPRGLELHALDVGHGSALVLRAPGLEALVFDAGSRDRRGVASEALVPLLARWEVARPWVVLSHPDHDHAAALARLAERFPWRGLVGAEPAQGLVRLPHGAQRLDLALGRLEFFSNTAGLRLALLRGQTEPGNEGSRALEVGWRGERLLLLGDAEEAGLGDLPLAPGPLRCLLAPHHGSDAPALGRLLDSCPPREVWISAAGRPAIGRELDRRRIPWRWTGRDGPLALGLP